MDSQSGTPLSDGRLNNMTNLIGTDISIQECRASGYVVLDQMGLVKKGKLDKDKKVRVTLSNPNEWPDGRNRPGATNHELYIYDVMLSWNNLWEQFKLQGKGIRDFCDWDNCPHETKNPTVEDMVQLAQTVSTYCGLWD